jgi:hypothetical protein
MNLSLVDKLTSCVFNEHNRSVEQMTPKMLEKLALHDANRIINTIAHCRHAKHTAFQYNKRAALRGEWCLTCSSGEFQQELINNINEQLESLIIDFKIFAVDQYGTGEYICSEGHVIKRDINDMPNRCVKCKIASATGPEHDSFVWDPPKQYKGVFSEWGNELWSNNTKHSKERPTATDIDQIHDLFGTTRKPCKLPPLQLLEYQPCVSNAFITPASIMQDMASMADVDNYPSDYVEVSDSSGDEFGAGVDFWDMHNKSVAELSDGDFSDSSNISTRAMEMELMEEVEEEVDTDSDILVVKPPEKTDIPDPYQGLTTFMKLMLIRFKESYKIYEPITKWTRRENNISDIIDFNPIQKTEDEMQRIRDIRSAVFYVKLFFKFPPVPPVD